MARAERVEVGDDAGERGLRLQPRLATGDARALLGLRGLEGAGERAGQADGQDAFVDEARGADRQRRLHHVVAAEDEVTEADEPGVGERRAHRDEPGRLREARGDRRRARHRGRGDRSAATHEPHTHAAFYVHSVGPFDTARA